MNAQQKLRQVLQEILNAEADGWLLADYIVVMGLQKIEADGTVETTSWLTSPQEQADYITDGLLQSAVDMRWNCED